jgi:transcriptional regulator with XRE-family HTH domain
MRFPHVAWAVAERGVPQYKVAAMIGRSEARISRCLSGRTDFTPDERAAIAQALGFPETWLFEEVTPPPVVACANRMTDNEHSKAE